MLKSKKNKDGGTPVSDKKKMIFIFSVVAVVAVAIIVIVIGQITGAFPIIGKGKNGGNDSSSSSSSGGPGVVYENTDDTKNIGGTESRTYSPEESDQAKSDDYYIEQAQQNPIKMTLEVYEKINIPENAQNTVTYAEVRDMLGGDGVKMDTNDAATEIYMWASTDNKGYAKLTFKNGVIAGKSQWGLK